MLDVLQARQRLICLGGHAGIMFSTESAPCDVDSLC